MQVSRTIVCVMCVLLVEVLISKSDFWTQRGLFLQVGWSKMVGRMN